MSKFKGLFDAPQEKGRKAAPRPKTRPEAKPAPKRGRPAGPAGGKRSNPDYTAITAYVRRDSLREVKAKLAREEKDLSDIVQEAFDGYLNT